jgi:hypothetical protein
MPSQTPTFAISPFDADALIHAAATRNTEEIDAITDRLAEQGVCRPRDDMSRMAEWIERRPVDAKPIPGAETILAESAIDGLPDIGSQMAAHFRDIFQGAQA